MPLLAKTISRACIGINIVSENDIQGYFLWLKHFNFEIPFIQELISPVYKLRFYVYCALIGILKEIQTYLNLQPLKIREMCNAV